MSERRPLGQATLLGCQGGAGGLLFGMCLAAAPTVVAWAPVASILRAEVLDSVCGR